MNSREKGDRAGSMTTPAARRLSEPDGRDEQWKRRIRTGRKQLAARFHEQAQVHAVLAEQSQIGRAHV